MVNSGFKLSNTVFKVYQSGSKQKSLVMSFNKLPNTINQVGVEVYFKVAFLIALPEVKSVFKEAPAVLRKVFQEELYSPTV